MRIQTKNSKKTQSEMISYVLLIIIALVISTGVYAWIRWIAPSQHDAQTCSEDVALVINSYSCNNQIIFLTVENKGFFTIDGFFARATNDSNKIPTYMLLTMDPWADLVNVQGRYDFKEKFMPGQINVTRFSYQPIGSIKKVQLQPFVTADKGQLLICKNIAEINVEGC